MSEQTPSRRTVLRGVVAAGCSAWLSSMLSGCEAKSPEGERSNTSAPAESPHKKRARTVQAQAQAIDWRLLGGQRVVFGHQSVGANVLQGVARLAAQDGARIEIRERRLAPALAGINHFRIGSNGDPASKIRDFAAAFDAGAGQGADLALMKLCYVDFEFGTDARLVANEYMSSLDALAQRHPATRFVAVTAPLVAVRTGPKAWIKRVVGQLRGRASENATRTEFNALLRQRYVAPGQLFDLARIESAAEDCCPPDDERRAGLDAGPEIEALRPELTDDGGHLNERGQLLAARALLDLVGAVAARGTAG